jgi:hypothetical protein
MGKLMRRCWVPVLLSWELSQPDCPPLEVSCNRTTEANSLFCAFDFLVDGCWKKGSALCD